MGVLGRLLGRRMDRRRGVLAVDAVEDAEPDAPAIPRPPDTAGTARLERPEPTPSMHVPGMQPTAGTRDFRQPGGTPSTQRLHNPRRPGR